MGAALLAIGRVLVVLAGVVAFALLVPGAGAAQSTATGGDGQPGSSDGETQTSTVVWVAPTLDGSPTFLYYSPHEGDRAVVLPEATPLLLVSGEVEGDGQRWYVVHTPDDDAGYILV